MTTTAPLADGTAMPQIGLGVYQVTRAGACEAAVRSALQAGYRLLDTAAVYGNERAVGRGIAASGVPRDEILLTTKIWPSDYAYPRARAAITAALDRLGTDHVDLMLLHQPVGDVPGAWRALEEAVDAGTIRSLGVSNFSADDLRTLLRTARIRPVVDQVELHPYWQQADLLPFLRAEGIVPEAWYPIGHGATDLLAEPAITAAATRLGRSPVQVILRWHVQHGFVAIPRSTNPAHIAANLDVFDFALSEQEMAAIDTLGRDRPLMRTPRWVLSGVQRFIRPRQLA
jgi:diketogulonate reductase-like aldo/keto reductase